ncbi:MAG: hypothetical protein E7449_06700 [Ruminococcaceae bacterium]|nr:hypothetical protein [Oscillospiraceae bacterium]
MAFSHGEQYQYWKRKWLREHRVLIVMLCVLYALALIVGFYKGVAWSFGVCSIIALAAFLILRNRMLLYIDQHTEQ